MNKLICATTSVLKQQLTRNSSDEIANVNFPDDDMYTQSPRTITRSSSRDETANVNFFTTTSYTHYKITTFTVQ